MTQTSSPEAADEAGWAAVVAAGRLGECEPGHIVAALRALFRDGDQRLVRALTLNVSDRITRRLRRLIGTGHRNAGEDIVGEAHAALMAAIFDPDSADGAALVDAFWPRIRFRGIDAARVARDFDRHHLFADTGSDGEPLVPPKIRLDAGPGSADVAHLLGRIRDPRKRLAFRLYAEGMRVRSGDPCVASACGCDPKTAAAWISEARAILAAEIGA